MRGEKTDGMSAAVKLFIISNINGNKALIHRALKIAGKERLGALIIAGAIALKGFRY